MIWWSKWDTLIEREEIELVKFKVNEIFIFFFWLKVIGNGKLKEEQNINCRRKLKRNCKNNVAKLIDFSLSMSIPEGQLHVQVFHIRGKRGYAMPEYVRMGYLIENADVYSFGVLILTLLAGQGSCLYGEYDTRLII